MTHIKLYNFIIDKVQWLVSRLSLDRRLKTHHTGRPRTLGMVQAIACGLFQKVVNIKTKKRTHQILESRCSYRTFVRRVNEFAPEAALILAFLLKLNRGNDDCPVKITDSTDIPVCLVKNAKHHKTMAGLASWGKTGKGWFYGLKLHLTVSLNRKVLALAFTTGGAHDSTVFVKLNKKLKGLFLADAAYAGAKLVREFYEATGNLLFAAQRKNMKRIAAVWQNALYRFRMMIEWDIRSLKEFYGLGTSLPRSINGYLANYVYAILGYLLA